MQPADLLQDLGVGPLGEIRVYELADEELHGRPLLLLDGWPLRGVDVVDGILDEHSLGLTDVLHRLLPLERLEERGHPGRCLWVPEEIAATVLEQVADDLDVHPRKVIETDLEAVENNVFRHNAEVGKLG